MRIYNVKERIVTKRRFGNVFLLKQTKLPFDTIRAFLSILVCKEQKSFVKISPHFNLSCNPYTYNSAIIIKNIPYSPYILNLEVSSYV